MKEAAPGWKCPAFGLLLRLRPWACCERRSSSSSQLSAMFRAYRSRDGDGDIEQVFIYEYRRRIRNDGTTRAGFLSKARS